MSVQSVVPPIPPKQGKSTATVWVSDSCFYTISQAEIAASLVEAGNLVIQNGRSTVGTDTKSCLFVQQKLYHCHFFCFSSLPWKLAGRDHQLLAYLAVQSLTGHHRQNLKGRQSSCKEGLCCAVRCSLCQLCALTCQSPPCRVSQYTPGSTHCLFGCSGFVFPSSVDFGFVYS